MSGDNYYEDEPEIKIYGVRLETDEEFNNRLERSRKARLSQKKSVEKRKLNKQDKELQQYKKLKEKFEGK